MSGNENLRLLGAVTHPHVDWERVHVVGRAIGSAVVSVVKSTVRLVSACSITGTGLLIITGGVMMVRQPDSLLLQQAIKTAAQQHQPLPASALAERDLYLLVMGIGVVILLLGLHALGTWRRGRSQE